MKFRLKRFDWYTILTFVCIGLAVYFLRTSWVLIPVCLALGGQYEFVYFNVSLILRQYFLFRQKKIDSIKLTKVQAFLKSLFRI